MKKTQIVIAIAAVVLLFGGYAFYKIKIAKPAIEQNFVTVMDVAEFIGAPTDEKPISIVITDPKANQLQEFDLFEDAKEGDIVLIFRKTGKAVLYNPKNEKIIAIAPYSDR